MGNKIEFLGLPFDNLSMEEVLEKIDSHIQERTHCKVFTPNVALLIWARKDEFLRKVYRASEILTVDGYAIFYAMRILGIPIKATLSPSVFYYPLLRQAQQKGYRLYLVGAKECVVKKNIEVLSQKYPGLNIVGWHDGYFDVTNPPKELLNDIRKMKTDLLLVGMTSPLKEKFVDLHMHDMDANVCIGVGGMFDIVAGEAKYAPKWIRVMALEWLYRLIQEPGRMWKRYLTTNSVFLWLLLIEFAKCYVLPSALFPRKKDGAGGRGQG